MNYETGNFPKSAKRMNRKLRNSQLHTLWPLWIEETVNNQAIDLHRNYQRKVMTSYPPCPWTESFAVFQTHCFARQGASNCFYIRCQQISQNQTVKLFVHIFLRHEMSIPPDPIQLELHQIDPVGVPQCPSGRVQNDDLHSNPCSTSIPGRMSSGKEVTSLL
jgi:hypothetical protein